MEPQHVEHAITPVFNEESEVLVLGTMPSPKSREVGFYYGHPQNRFWRVLAALFDEPAELLMPERTRKGTGGANAANADLATVNARRTDFLLRHHIALWDVLASCDIAGASDASIENVQVNDLAHIIDHAPIKAVFCTGAKAAQLYRRYCQETTGIPCVQLPSTSPANAAWNLERLAEAYTPLVQAVTPERRPTLPVSQVVALERAIDAAGTSLAELMERAGLMLAYRVHKRWPDGRVAVLCGNGNNGGDGWVAARHLAAWGHDVTLVSAKQPAEITAHPAAEAARSAEEQLQALGARVLYTPDVDTLAAALKGAVIVDALLGTGFLHDQVREPFATWIALANEARGEGATVVAADVPSGLNADTGQAAQTTIRADETVTMIVGKLGLQAPGADAYCGTVTIAPLACLTGFLR